MMALVEGKILQRRPVVDKKKPYSYHIQLLSCFCSPQGTLGWLFEMGFKNDLKTGIKLH